MDAVTVDAWLDQYPVLTRLTSDHWRRLSHNAHHRRYHAQEIVFHDGSPCQGYFFILSGSIRVQKHSSSGHSIVLYHLHPGDSCEVTTLSLLAKKHYSAEAIAETTVEVLIISPGEFSELLARSSEFQQFVFAKLEKGMDALIQLIETIAFGHIDQRLARYLINACDAQQQIHTTHNDIANELGTAREVVSRVLKSFEQHHYVRLHRGWVELTHMTKLKQIANNNLV